MARIRGSGNRATELRLIALMREHGITGWRRNATMPANNRAFWKAKLARNSQRDRDVTRTLRKAGWRVVRVWECALARPRFLATLACIARPLGAGG
jgi:DNA mismatch endonuclease, patch repair protein